MHKFRMTEILTVSVFLPPGSFTRHCWCISFKSVLNIIGITLAIYQLVQQYMQIAAPRKPIPQSSSLISSSTASASNSSTNETDVPLPGFNVSSASAAFQITLISTNIVRLMSATTNFTLRIITWFIFPQVIFFYQQIQLMDLHKTPELFKWTKNELALLFLALISLARRIGVDVEEIIVDQVDTKPIQIISKLAIDWIGESFVIDCAALVLIIVVTLVASIIKQTGNSVSTLLEQPLHNIHTSVDVTDNDPKTRPQKSFWIQYPSHDDVDDVFTINYNNHTDAANNIITLKQKETHGSSKLNKNNIKMCFPEMENLIKSYFELSALWKDIEIAIGVVTLLLFFYMTASLSFLCFISVTLCIERGFFDGKSIDNAGETILTVVRMVCLGNAAHTLQEASQHLLERLLMLQQYWNFCANKSQEDRIKEKHLSHLMNYLVHNPLKLSTLGFFTVSRSTLTSIAGVIVTYIVVLIQFRTSSQSSVASKS